MVVRIRPMNERETAGGDLACAEVSPDDLSSVQVGPAEVDGLGWVFSKTRGLEFARLGLCRGVPGRPVLCPGGPCLDDSFEINLLRTCMRFVT